MSNGVLWCAAAELAVCQPMPSEPDVPDVPPPHPGPAPMEPKCDVGLPPTSPGMPTHPGPEPEPPVPPTTTTQMVPDVPERVPTEARRSNLAIGGILLLLVVGGGYAVYRSRK
jgi:hypothetical protein